MHSLRTMPSAFVNQLLRVRRENNLTQVGLAHAIKVDPMCVSRWERGTNLPGRESWERLAEMYPEIFKAGACPTGLDAVRARRKKRAKTTEAAAVSKPKKLRGPRMTIPKAKATKLANPITEIGKEAAAAAAANETTDEVA